MLSLLSDTSTSTTRTKAIESVLVPRSTGLAWQRLDVCPQQHSSADYWNLDFLEKGRHQTPALPCWAAPRCVRHRIAGLTRYAEHTIILQSCVSPLSLIDSSIYSLRRLRQLVRLSRSRTGPCRGGADCRSTLFTQTLSLSPARIWQSTVLQSPSAVPPQPPGPAAHELAWLRRRTRSRSPFPSAPHCDAINE